jgi:hypothetical protein
MQGSAPSDLAHQERTHRQEDPGRDAPASRRASRRARASPSATAAGTRPGWAGCGRLGELIRRPQPGRMGKPVPGAPCARLQPLHQRPDPPRGALAGLPADVSHGVAHGLAGFSDAERPASFRLGTSEHRRIRSPFMEQTWPPQPRLVVQWRWRLSGRADSRRVESASSGCRVFHR